jgi:MFS transporter, ACS family, tartrate transporter
MSSPPVVDKVLRRLIPFCILCYLLNYIDRVNISIAKLKMVESVPATGIPGFTDTVFARGAAIFFLGYFLFELPSNLIQERVGPRRWIARIMISWGLITMGFVFTPRLWSYWGEWSFYGLRFLLGLAEAGFFPGVILYLSYWVPRQRQAGAAALFLTSTAIAGVIGNPLGGYILYFTDHSPLGLHNWQWLFLLEGLPSVLLGLLTLFYLTDRPKDARWLSPEERATLTALMAQEHAQHPAHDKASLRHALQSPHTWMLSFIYGLVVFGFYLVNLFTPTILKEALKSCGLIHAGTLAAKADLWTSLFSAIPFGAAAVGMVIIGRHSDRRRERKYHFAFACGLIAVGLAVAAAGQGLPGTTGTILVIAGLSIAAVGAFGCFGPFWALPSQLMTGTAAAAAFAIINSIGNLLGGFLAPNLQPYLGMQRTLFLAAGTAAVALVLAVIAPLPRMEPAPEDAPATARVDREI